jgi:hypothetical protein
MFEANFKDSEEGFGGVDEFEVEGCEAAAGIEKLDWELKHYLRGNFTLLFQ